MKILDTQTGDIQEYGADGHDSIRVSQDGRFLFYYNLQNGDGSAYGDYRFVCDDNKVPSESETADARHANVYFNIGGWHKRPKGDLISREALKKAIDDYAEKRQDTLLWQSDIEDLIDNAPTVEPNRPQGEWIPVSERLPDDKDYHDCYGFPDGVVIWQTDNGDIGFGWYYQSTKCWSDTNDYPIKSGKVIAWQPLPEPYKKGGKK